MSEKLQHSNGRSGTGTKRLGMLSSVTWIAAVASGAAHSAQPRGAASAPIHHADLHVKLGVWVDRILPVAAALLIAAWTISFVAFGLDFVARFSG